MKYHTLFFSPKLGKMSQNLSSAAVVICTLRVKESIIDTSGKLLSKTRQVHKIFYPSLKGNFFRGIRKAQNMNKISVNFKSTWSPIHSEKGVR